ncbi:transposon tf2-9 polyprotein [Plakobranchus ocellatus]|uniref:Transposon tf2-9 polyprotein n=1 Tax=Plakobranchus ocellatus TaxID=259542 RepID=A0AAV3ZVS2_9GAST|nr:transposon tf2-9 polyprotein [Plakobranchus ocellatus]
MDQVTAPLPQDRVTWAPPCSVTGTDPSGPLYCSDTGDKKLYIVLFTCAVTRAPHLELVDSLSVDDFILAFRRFVARRELCQALFILIMQKPLRRPIPYCRLILVKRLTDGKNICPLSPNWGGWWERLVISVKSSLRKSLGRQTVNKVILETILPEIEASVNSRPLMYIAEKGKILTPSHFLIGRATPLTSTELKNVEQIINVSEREELEESLIEKFWQIWETEYLRNLPLSHSKVRLDN